MSSPPARAAAGAPPDAGLEPAIGRNMLLILVGGDVLGAGIYALVGEVGGRVGGAIWTTFAVALLLAVFTAFAYAELGLLVVVIALAALADGQGTRGAPWSSRRASRSSGRCSGARRWRASP